MIKINNLNFSYKKKDLFHNLNLSIETGKVYGLLGENGAGKTTLLKLITGQLFPSNGSCFVMGMKSKRRSYKVLNEIYYLSESFSFPDISIEQYESINSPFYTNYNPDDFTKFLDEFKLDRSLNLNSISYGQKKKVLISFGLATNTKYLILDEPTNGLDIPSKAQFRKILATSINENRSIIISTHQVKDIELLIDGIIILSEGKILFNQNVYDILNKLAFKKIDDSDFNVLYSEDYLGGRSGIVRNVDEVETALDIEMLFKAIITHPKLISNEFKK